MSTSPRSWVLGTLAFLAACSNPGLKDPTHATGSSTVVAASDGASLFAVNTDEGTLARISPDSGVNTTIDVGSEPTRIARAGERLFVTLRGERAVAILQETGNGATLSDVIPVGAEPFGIVASEDGSRVYVAVSQANQVLELDANNLVELRAWKVDHEPRYLALHPSGDTLFVGTALGRASVTRIDLTAGEETPSLEPVPLPNVVRFDIDGEHDLTPRLTGDLSFAPDGGTLVVPVLYVDNITPVGDPNLDENGDPTGETVDNGYGGQVDGVSRFNPSVVAFPTDRHGDIAGDAEAIFVSGLIEDRHFMNDFTNVRSYPSSVTVSPDGTTYAMTFEGSNAVALVGALPFDENSQHRGEDIAMSEPVMFDGEGGDGALPQVFTPIFEAGFTTHPKSLVVADAGPRGIAFLGKDEAFVHSFIDRSVARLNYQGVFEDVRQQGMMGFDEISSRRTQNSKTISESTLPEDVEAGRRLFYSATNGHMVASGAGVSCGTCHSDGRNDGLTWTFDSGVRQTPTLAGKVSETHPVTWTSEVESVMQEARITTEARMGGTGLTETQLGQIAAFVDWTRDVDVQDKGLDTDQVRHGKAIFEREDVACASCHNGAAYTDNDHHDMFGLDNVNTPTLRGIAASAPYFHDGRAGTLRDVILFSRNGEMGDTSMLDEAEMDALEAYLKTL